MDGTGRGRGELVTTALLVALGVVIEMLSPSAQLELAYALRSTVLRPVLAVQREAARRSSLSVRLGRFEAERDSLARELVAAREAEQQNAWMRTLLGLGMRPADSLVAVEVEPGRVPGGQDQTFLLRVGTAEGIAAPTGVFTVRGLIGVVRASTAHASQGQFWTHPDFRVSVRTASGQASGIVRAGEDGGQRAMILDGAPYQTDIAPGTVLYTSGIGDLYPPGIPVGTVRAVSAVESGWEKSYRVEPAVRPEQVDIAFVWRKPSRP